MKRIFLITAFISILASIFLIPLSTKAGLPRPPIPPLLVPVPPPVVLIPGTYAYFAPGLDADLLFYQGYWYRPYEGQWYRAGSYRGPWGVVPGSKIPRVLINLPPDYRSGHERIPYGQLKKNWRSWEQEKHWDKHEKKKKRHGDHDREEHARSEHGRGHGKRY